MHPAELFFSAELLEFLSVAIIFLPVVRKSSAEIKWCAGRAVLKDQCAFFFEQQHIDGKATAYLLNWPLPLQEDS